MIAEVFAPGLISTDSMEHSSPVFSPDGTVVLWTVVDNNYHASLFEMNYNNGKWSAPQRPSFADSTADDYYPSFSADGKKLYFSSRRKMPEGYPSTIDIRIWEVERSPSEWSKPVPFDTIISQGHDYAHSIAKSGSIYFASSLGGGTNWNLQKSKMSDGKYEKPVLLPYNINSVDYEEGPCIAPDESFLIFESVRPEGIDGNLDLYISFNDERGWSIPVNMGPKINTSDAERFARLSPDGKYLFFGSSRNQSSGKRGFDIYWIDARVIDELRKQAGNPIIEQPLGDDLIQSLYKNDIDNSTRLLKKWLGLHPANPDAIIIYTTLLLKQKRYAETEQILADNFQRWPDNKGMMMQMVILNYGLEKNNEAEKILEQVLKDKNQAREKYISLSFSLLEMGKHKLSEDYFQKAMAIFPSSFPAWRRGRALTLIGEKDKAFEALNKAVEYGGINSRKEFENDPDLRSLHIDARWNLLLEKMK